MTLAMVSAAGSGCHGVFKYKFCRWNWSASNRSVCRWCIYGQVQELMSISDNIGKMNSSQMSKALINQVMQNIDDIGNGICGRRWLSRVVRGVMLHALRSHPSPCLDLATLMIITMVLLMLMVVKWKMLKQEVHYANKIGPSVSSSPASAHGHSLLRALQLAQSFSHIPIFHMYKFYAYQSYPVLKRKYFTCNTFTVASSSYGGRVQSYIPLRLFVKSCDFAK